jgi:hypothetical protein
MRPRISSVMTSKLAYQSTHFSMKCSCAQGVKIWVAAVAMLSVGDARGTDDSRPRPADSSPEAIGGELSEAGKSFENTLGMRFLSVPGTQVAFSVWDTRVQDYQLLRERRRGIGPVPSFNRGRRIRQSMFRGLMPRSSANG